MQRKKQIQYFSSTVLSNQFMSRIMRCYCVERERENNLLLKRCTNSVCPSRNIVQLLFLLLNKEILSIEPKRNEMSIMNESELRERERERGREEKKRVDMRRIKWPQNRVKRVILLVFRRWFFKIAYFNRHTHKNSSNKTKIVSRRKKNISWKHKYNLCARTMNYNGQRMTKGKTTATATATIDACASNELDHIFLSDLCELRKRKASVSKQI